MSSVWRRGADVVSGRAGVSLYPLAASRVPPLPVLSPPVALRVQRADVTAVDAHRAAALPAPVAVGARPAAAG